MSNETFYQSRFEVDFKGHKYSKYNIFDMAKHYR